MGVGPDDALPSRRGFGVSGDDAVNAESDEQDRQDMQSLAAGREFALDALINRHGARLFNYLTRYLGSHAEAEDCVQETFVRVYLHRARFRPAARFSTWLYTIATNRARNMRRARRAECALDEIASIDSLASMADPAAMAAEQMALQEQAEEVRQAVLALPEELRAPLVLFEFDNLSQAEIAEILGCTRKAVEVRIYRARQILRKALSVTRQVTAQIVAKL
jgi:RNA polymerase sigma-70 factor, ECF subfamily